MRTELNYVVSADDYRDAVKLNRTRLLRLPSVRRISIASGLFSATVWFGIALLASHLLSAGRSPLGSWFFVALVAGVFVMRLQAVLVERAVLKSAIGSPELSRSAYRLQLEPTGLSLSTDHANYSVGWSGVRAVTEGESLTVIGHDRLAFIPITHAAFSGPQERAEFLQAIRAQAGLASSRPVEGGNGPSLSSDRSSAGSQPTRRWANFIGNLKCGLRLAMFRRPSAGAIDASWSQFVALAALSIAIPVAGEFVTVGVHGTFASYALPGAVFHLPLMIVAAWSIALLARQAPRTLEIAVAILATLIPIDVVFEVLDAATDEMSVLPRTWREFATYVPLLWLTLAIGVASIRHLAIAKRRRLWAIALPAVLIALPLSTIYHDGGLWTKPYDPESAEEYQRKHMAIASEDTFYLQPKLLERELEAVKPGPKDAINLYFVGAAGYSSQDVFMKEVHLVAKLFRERFGTDGRSVMLINNPATVTESPIASATSLSLALQRVGSVMNRDKDILFLYLTSHGSQDHKFSLDFWPLRFNTLDPKRLREILDASGIKRRVIVVAACYSGGFIDALKDDNSLVITAAASDKTSFGCSNEADFTYFGKAYFDEALKGTYSFIDAFNVAKPVIAAREAKDDFNGSDPQIFVGSAIRQPLDEFVRARQLPQPAPLESKPKLIQTNHKYDEFLDLLALPSVVRQSQKNCMREMDIASPANLVRTQPDTYGGLGPNSPHWPRLVAAWQNYVEDVCRRAATESQYMDSYRAAWQSHLNESELESTLKIFKTPAGKRWLSAQVDVGDEASSRIARVRAPMIEGAMARLRSEASATMAEYQKDAQAAAKKSVAGQAAAAAAP